MVSDELGYQLHERAMHGETLSAEDLARLEACHAQQDRVGTEQSGLTIAESTAIYATGNSPLSGVVPSVGIIPPKRRAVAVRRTKETQSSATIKPRTELGRCLWAMRARIVASGEPLLGWEDIRRELAERRGERESSMPRRK